MKAPQLRIVDLLIILLLSGVGFNYWKSGGPGKVVEGDSLPPDIQKMVDQKVIHTVKLDRYAERISEIEKKLAKIDGRAKFGEQVAKERQAAARRIADLNRQVRRTRGETNRLTQFPTRPPPPATNLNELEVLKRNLYFQLRRQMLQVCADSRGS